MKMKRHIHRNQTQTLFTNEKQKGTAASGKESKAGLLSKYIKPSIQQRESDLTVYDLESSNILSEGKYKKMQFGVENPHKANKVIVMVGETGSGKTTLINSLINCILGVGWEDKYRYRLIEENTGKSKTQSQTSHVTIYQIHHMEGFTIPYSLTILDTPGSGSTEGIDQDRLIAQQLKDCFNPHWGVDRIDAICFVVKASVTRLTTMQRYVFDSIISLFGKDIKHNILICVTFADHTKPQVIQALLDAQVPCAKEGNDPLYFKFSNSDLYTKRSGEDEDDVALAKIFYKMGRNSSTNLFMTLGEMTSQSLYMTKEVLKEREILEITMEGLLPRIQEAALKQHELEKTERILQQHEDDIRNNRNFEYEEQETIKEKKYGKENAINCHKCEMTCHHPCRVPFDHVTALCEVFTWGRVCTVCGHNAGMHYCENHIWESKVETKKKTYSALKEKYERACEGKSSKETLYEMLSGEIRALEEKQMKLIEKAATCLGRLREIALKPDPLSAPDYIDLLINAEKHEAKPGYRERITSLEKAKRKAEKLQEIEKNST
ncbi:hypothetical protein XENTR_v10015683 [Xenopus tropicalis]|nr:hypothetical protein XENTR_v10015683 [Xenopus tropicalis]|eukprot:XP_012809584.2 PREDICTED: uncharacterized protein LOC100487810 [Xenopus tropicalis]